MSFLDDLRAEDRTLLVSLPFRVGLFVSQSDQSGGDDSDEAEMQALSSIITAYSQEVFGAETVQYVISETVRRKNEWDGWSDNLDAVDTECHKAVDLLSMHVDEKEVSAFKNHLIEIGESVALAFREYGASTPLIDKIRMYIYYFQNRRKALKGGDVYKEWDQFVNISLDERKALCFVAEALGKKYV